MFQPDSTPSAAAMIATHAGTHHGRPRKADSPRHSRPGPPAPNRCLAQGPGRKFNTSSALADRHPLAPLTRRAAHRRVHLEYYPAPPPARSPKVPALGRQR